MAGNAGPLHLFTWRLTYDSLVPIGAVKSVVSEEQNTRQETWYRGHSMSCRLYDANEQVRLELNRPEMYLPSTHARPWKW
jgi:hypothetical protein